MKMDKDDFALLKVIASSIETIKEDLREMKEGMKSKVEISEFNQIKTDVEDLKKSKWFVLGASGAISTLLHFFMK
jgi:hypothetical protein